MAQMINIGINPKDHRDSLGPNTEIQIAGRNPEWEENTGLGVIAIETSPARTKILMD
jgi:hypothetical protein